MNGYVSKSAFAKIYGCVPSYVTKLIAQKQVVLSEDGRLVNVDASLRLIEATGDPSKQGVRDRWNAYREGKAIDIPPAQSTAFASDSQTAPGGRRGGAHDGATSAYHQARTEREQIETQLKQIELRRQLGEIAEVPQIVKAVLDTHLAARSAILQLPDRLAQLVAPELDPLKVHDLIRIECERVCDNAARNIKRLRDQAGIEIKLS